MTVSARSIVDAFLARFGSGDLPGLLELFADRVDFSVPGASNVPWTGNRSTKAEVTDFFTLLMTGGLTEAEAFDVDDTIVDGENVVIAGRSRFRVVATDKHFDNSFAIVFTVIDGLIARYHMHEDSHAISVAFTA